MLGREISPKHQARLHSMEPPNAASKKGIMINSARGQNTGAYSERDNSNDPMKGMQMNQAYQSARLNP